MSATTSCLTTDKQNAAANVTADVIFLNLLLDAKLCNSFSRETGLGAGVKMHSANGRSETASGQTAYSSTDFLLLSLL